MKKWIIRILILLIYCLPYVFYAMRVDLDTRSILGWNIMLLTFLVLMITCIKTNNFIVEILGNIVSFIISYLCVSTQTIEKWEWYFKPFTATGNVTFISVALLIIQLIVWGFVYNKRKNAVSM